MQHVSDLLPGSQIGTVENGDSGEIAKSGMDHVIAIFPPGYTGIGIKTGQQGIVDAAAFEATGIGVNAASGQKHQGQKTQAEGLFQGHRLVISNCGVSYQTAVLSAPPNRGWAFPVQQEWAGPNRSESKESGHRATKWLHGSAL